MVVVVVVVVDVVEEHTSLGLDTGQLISTLVLLSEAEKTSNVTSPMW